MHMQAVVTPHRERYIPHPTPNHRNTPGPTIANSPHPTNIRIIPGHRKSRDRSVPCPYAIELGGVLITNGTPIDAPSATNIATDAVGEIPSAS